MINRDDFAAWVGVPWPALVGLLALAAVVATAFGGSKLAILASFGAVFVVPVGLLRALRGRRSPGGQGHRENR